MRKITRQVRPRSGIATEVVTTSFPVTLITYTCRHGAAAEPVETALPDAAEMVAT